MSEEIPTPETHELLRQGKFFPIRESTRILYGLRDTPEMVEDTIVRSVRRAGKEQWEKFVLKKKIGEFNYIFSLSECDSKVYTFDFKTEEYEYALTELDEDSEKELTETCAMFLEDATGAAQGLQLVRGWGAPGSYSRSEIDECKAEILASPENTLEVEDVDALRGSDVFDAYLTVFGKEFPKQNNKLFRSRGRARLFRIAAKKVLPDWDVADNDTGEIFLQKKSNQNISE